VYFVSFVRRRLGEHAQWAAIALLSTYPGIAYWVGLPYSYAAIVPGMLLSTVLLCTIDRTDRAGTILGCCALLGLISVAYDLLPYLAPAVMLMLVLKRRWLLAGPAVVAMVLPMSAFTLILSHVFSVPLGNANSGIYRTVLTSYLDGVPGAVWWRLIQEAPWLLWHNWIYSNFLFLPLLFMLLLPVASWLGMAVGRVEGAVLCAALCVFLLNNMAPPYPGWQMRGTFIPRLYQPIFGVLILFCCRVVQAAEPFPRVRWAVAALVVGAMLGNAAVTYGPALGMPVAAHVYHHFYRHGPPNALSRNLKTYGRRPRGLCDEKPQRKRARRRAARARR
jgi:hypothetical protein